MNDIVLIVLLGICITIGICMTIGLFCGYMLFRIDWVYEYRVDVLHDDMGRYDKLPTFHAMLYSCLFTRDMDKVVDKLLSSK